MSASNQSHAEWADERFHSVVMRNQGGGIAPYRQCRCCGSFAMEGALSAHARWCDQERNHAVLAAFDGIKSGDRRQHKNAAGAVRSQAKSAF
jgi:hypothetical protein